MSNTAYNFKEELENLTSWPWQEAKRILQNRGVKDSYLLQTGYGPSGLPHLGTFAEVLRTSMIATCLSHLTDAHIDIYVFSDDLDGLRRVPENVPQQDLLAQYLTQPLTSVPDPFACHDSFGEHNNSMLRRFLDSYNFKYTFKSATSCYKEGTFNPQLRQILENYETVRDLVLPTLREERRRTYSPFLPIDKNSGEVLETEILTYSRQEETVSYRDKNGKLQETSILDGNCKLQWKCDWAARWMCFDIDYEMAGKDLRPSFELSASIARKLKHKPPLHMTYELFLDNDGHKISKSKGNGISMDEWLEVAPPASLSYYLFLKPKVAKKLSLEVAAKATDDYLSLGKKYSNLVDKEKYNSVLWHIETPKETNFPPISFNLLIGLVRSAKIDNHTEILKLLAVYNNQWTPDNYPMLTELSQKAINYASQTSTAKTEYTRPTIQEIEALSVLQDKLRSVEKQAPLDSTLEQIIYDTGKEVGYAHDLRAWFKLLYGVLIGDTSGPRIGTFIAVLGLEKTIRHIDAIIKREDLLEQVKTQYQIGCITQADALSEQVDAQEDALLKKDMKASLVLPDKISDVEESKKNV